MKENITLFARQSILDRKGITCAYHLDHKRSSTNEINSASGLLSSLFFDLDAYTVADGCAIYIDLDIEDLNLPPVSTASTFVLFLTLPDKVSDELQQAINKLIAEGYKLGLKNPNLDTLDCAFIDQFSHIKLSAKLLGINEVLRQAQHPQLQHKIIIATDLTISQQVDKITQVTNISQYCGNFFNFREEIKGKKVPIYRTLIVELLTKINAPMVSLGELAAIIEKDSTLSYKIIKLTKSAIYYRNFNISNVQRALEVIGLRDLVKWFGMALVTSIDGKPDCLYRMAISRAFFTQAISEELFPNLDGAFIVGLFSYLPAFFNEDMATLLKQVPLDPKINDALLTHSGNLGGILKIVTLYESGQWSKLPYDSLERSGIDEKTLRDFYITSLQKTHALDLQ